MASHKGKTAAFILTFVALIAVLTLTLYKYVTSYNLFQAVKGSAAVIAKTAKKGLLQPPVHYVKVDINVRNGDDMYEGILNRVTAAKMKNVELGDRITGYIIDNQRFFTLYDLIVDGILMIGIIAFILFLMVLLIAGMITSREANKQKRSSFSFQTAFIVGFFIVAAVLTTTFLINSFHKIIPLDQTKTDAVIVEKHAERKWIFINETADPIYEFTLTYNDRNDLPHRVVKEVTPHTFQRYETFDLIPISYRNSNPFDIFHRDMVMTDVYEIALYWQFFIYIAIMALSILIGVYTLRNYLKKRRRN